MINPISPGLLRQAIDCRQPLFDAKHHSAFRLFNGFAEGCPELVVDIYGDTALFQNYADPPERGARVVEIAVEVVRTHLPWVNAAILKQRRSDSVEERRGTPLFGSTWTTKIAEHGVWYAVDLTLNRDAGLYLDTGNLRRWAFDHLRGKTVLNAFAYTGSLGVAAQAGGADRVIQLDRTRQFLNMARESLRLNGLPARDEDFVQADFFRQAADLRRRHQRFDCVFVDPPFFATAPTGRIDQATTADRLINKVRPLVAQGGYLVTINNALYVSGAEYIRTLDALCDEGYMNLIELIPVPEDYVGYPETRTGRQITDPAPFNHSTKIAVLQVS